MKILNLSILVLSFLVFGACASKDVITKTEDVKFSRVDPPKRVSRSLGQSVVAPPSSGKTEEAVSDMKTDAAHKGANFVKVWRTFGYRTVVTGVAYRYIIAHCCS